MVVDFELILTVRILNDASGFEIFLGGGGGEYLCGKYRDPICSAILKLIIVFKTDNQSTGCLLTHLIDTQK